MKLRRIIQNALRYERKIKGRLKNINMIAENLMNIH